MCAGWGGREPIPQAPSAATQAPLGADQGKPLELVF